MNHIDCLKPRPAGIPTNCWECSQRSACQLKVYQVDPLALEALASILKSEWEKGRIFGREEATEELVAKLRGILP